MNYGQVEANPADVNEWAFTFTNQYGGSVTISYSAICAQVG